jgi:hypothetical protein
MPPDRSADSVNFTSQAPGVVGADDENESTELDDVTEGIESGEL